jgi:fibronectin-binding autotransporter adhesin
LIETGIVTNQDATDLLLGRLLDARDSGLWFTVFGDADQAGSQGARPGWHSTTGGGFAGYDLALGDSALVGLSGGYAATSLSQTAGRGAIDEPHVTAYGRIDFDGGALSALADLGFLSESGDRAASSTATATGKRSATATTVAAQIVFDAFALSDFAVAPRAGLSYLSLTEGAFAETGAGGLDMRGAQAGIDSLRPFVGLHAARNFALEDGAPLRLMLDLVYSHEVLDAAGAQTLIASDGTLFASTGVLTGRDSVSLRAELAHQIVAGFDLSLSYEVEGGRIFGQEIAIGIKHAL